MSRIRIIAARLALANTVTAEKWSGKVKTKWHPPEGFFSRSAQAIADGLMRESKDRAQAMGRLNFYINRGGENISSEDKGRLEHAKQILEKKTEASTIAARLQAHAELTARIKGADEYSWMLHQGGKLTLQTSKGPIEIDKGEVYGVRPSSNGKQIRFVQAEDHGINKVMTLTLDDAKKLAKTAKPTKEPT